MSGGVAYVRDRARDFKRRCNLGMVDLEPLTRPEDIALVRGLVERHVAYTGSALGQRLLEEWDEVVNEFVVVMPRDYRRVLETEAHALAEGREATFAELVGATSG
jgi:glutamate synthase domain-containing protein 3